MKIGEVIRKYRKAKQMTQEEMHICRMIQDGKNYCPGMKRAAYRVFD